jgi:hypothetical protein
MRSVRFGGSVQLKEILLDVLPVVALGVRQAEEALLQNRILAVPQRQGEAEPLFVVADARQAVPSPAVGPGARLIVGEVAPGIAVLALVLAHRAPLPFAHIRLPFLPGHAFLRRFHQTFSFDIFAHGLPLMVSKKNIR